jgi:hypothetical protein
VTLIGEDLFAPLKDSATPGRFIGKETCEQRCLTKDRLSDVFGLLNLVFVPSLRISQAPQVAEDGIPVQGCVVSHVHHAKTEDVSSCDRLGDFTPGRTTTCAIECENHIAGYLALKPLMIPRPWWRLHRAMIASSPLTLMHDRNIYRFELRGSMILSSFKFAIPVLAIKSIN